MKNHTIKKATHGLQNYFCMKRNLFLIRFPHFIEVSWQLHAMLFVWQNWLTSLRRCPQHWVTRDCQMRNDPQKKQHKCGFHHAYFRYFIHHGFLQSQPIFTLWGASNDYFNSNFIIAFTVLVAGSSVNPCMLSSKMSTQHPKPNNLCSF